VIGSWGWESLNVSHPAQVIGGDVAGFVEEADEGSKVTPQFPCRRFVHLSPRLTCSIAWQFKQGDAVFALTSGFWFTTQDGMLPMDAIITCGTMDADVYMPQVRMPSMPACQRAPSPGSQARSPSRRRAACRLWLSPHGRYHGSPSHQF
jgi:hypothetical protein